jgi:hypothetical protein
MVLNLADIIKPSGNSVIDTRREVSTSGWKQPQNTVCDFSDV